MIDKLELYELTKTLINFPSISPKQAGCIDYLEQILIKLGFNTKRLDKNDTSNLVAIMGDTGSIFAFAGHIDVVPTGDISKWDFDPFSLNEKNQELYGRGIADMKGSIAAFIVAVIKFLKINPKPPGKIALLITSDEESSAVDGTPVIVEYLKNNNIQIDYCLLGEPSSVDLLGDTIKIGRRGSLSAYLNVEGKQGHIAYPQLCINPIHVFTPALSELINTQWDSGNEIFPPTNLQIANINAGLGVTNVIANNLTSNFNFRYNNLHSADELKQQVITILDKHKLTYNITWVNSAKPFYTKLGRLLDVTVSSIEQQLGLTPQQKTDGGTSDGRFLVEVCTEIIEFGLSNKYIHQINERIKTDDLSSLADTYNLILNKIFND
jgi:succinyl-diaminopimelate desuccinylase